MGMKISSYPLYFQSALLTKLAMCQLYCIFWLFYQIPDVIKVVCIFSISSLFRLLLLSTLR